MWNYYIERKKKNSGVILQITKEILWNEERWHEKENGQKLAGFL